MKSSTSRVVCILYCTKTMLERESVQRAVARVEPGVIENKSAQREVARVEPGVRVITMIDFCEGERHQQQSVE
jgi:hypothetical protein